MALALLPASAHAAELAWRAPPECQRADMATEQVEKLVGRRLASIEAVTFEIEVAIDADGTHRVVLRTLATGNAPRERVITGVSCASVTDAVSVAIALTIQEEQRARAAEATAEGELAAASDAPLEAEPEPAPVAAGPTPLVLLGLAPLIDAGALPELAAGVDLGVALEVSALRAGASFAAFAPQEALLADESGGGRFDFVLGSVDLCGHPVFGDLHLLACAGFELGRMGARGTGIRNWRAGDAAWYAPRVLVGVGYGFAKVVRVFLRGGIAIPLARREFQVDGERLHQAGSSAVRASVGLELVL